MATLSSVPASPVRKDRWRLDPLARLRHVPAEAGTVVLRACVSHRRQRDHLQSQNHSGHMRVPVGAPAMRNESRLPFGLAHMTHRLVR